MSGFQNTSSGTVVIYFTDAGSPKTGLTITFSHYKDVTDPSSTSDISQPTIYEIANGIYAFRPVAVSDKTYSFVVDGSATLTDDSERYIAGEITWGDFTADVSNLDVSVSSRLATSGYTAPDNANILLIKVETDKIQSEIIDSKDDYKADVSNLDATVSSRLADADYTTPDNTNIALIKTETDKIQTDIINVPGNFKADVSNLDVAVSSRLATSGYTAPLTSTDKQDIINDIRGTDSRDLTVVYDKVIEHTSDDILCTTISQLTLDDDGVALGSAVDGDGIPVSNARIIAQTVADVTNNIIRFETYTDGSGDFSLVITLGATYRLRVMEPYYGFDNRYVTV